MSKTTPITIHNFDRTSIDSFPILKPSMDEGWFCQLKIGEITVEFNYKEYTIAATDNQSVCFLIVDGFNFSIKNASDDFLFTAIAVQHDVLSQVYAFLGCDANISVEIDLLVTTLQMESNKAALINNSFKQLEAQSNCQDYLLEADRTTTHLIVYCMMLYHNGISEWKKNNTMLISDFSEIDSHTQTYKLMSRLFDIFNEPESLCHRDAKYFSDRLNISARYFYQVCIKETGMTPKQFVNDVIVSEVKHTLLTTNLSFQQVASKFGFSDQSAFTQYFKRNTGVTPSEFRQQHK